jgi:hypothetical protein
VAVGIGLFWLRLHDAKMSPLPVIARVPKDELALEGAQVLVYVVASTVFALGVVFLTDVVRLKRRRSVELILTIVGLSLVLLAWPMERGSDLGIVDFGKSLDGIFIIERPERWSAVAGGGFLLAAALIFRRHRWNDWRFSVAIGLCYAAIATSVVFAYLAVSGRGTNRDELGPPVIVLLDNPRPQAKGKPRRRQEGRLVYASTDGVGICVQCEPDIPYRRVLEFPRRRVVWVRVQSRDFPPRKTPRKLELKPTG